MCVISGLECVQTFGRIFSVDLECSLPADSGIESLRTFSCKLVSDIASNCFFQLGIGFQLEICFILFHATQLLVVCVIVLASIAQDFHRLSQLI